MKHSFFQAAIVWILLYGSTTWTLTKWMGKKFDGNYTRMMQATLNNSWRQHPTKQQLYGHQPPITKTIKIRQTRLAEHCWRSRDELVRPVDPFTWTSKGRAISSNIHTYMQQLCADTGYGINRKQWTIGRCGERGPGISVLIARHDDIYVYIYIYK